MPTLVSVFGVEPSRIGGTETFARELSQQLGRHGWQSVLCFESPPPPNVAEFLSLPNTRLEILKDVTDFNVGATKQLARILKQYKADVLHLHFTGFVGVLPWIARLSGVKKIFFTDHSSRPEGYVPGPAPLWKRSLVRVINAPITKVICVSKYGLRCLRGLELLPADRFELVYNAVDMRRVKPSSELRSEFRKRFSIPDEKQIVLQTSWIIPEKGIPELLEVAQRVVAQNDRVQFVIVGEGPYRERYMNDAREMGIGESVTWTGLMKDPFNEGVYDAADVVCQLSRWEELFGWMIAEAMAYRKPVVATRAGGIPELIVDGESGFLVERSEVEETSKKLLELLSDPKKQEEMGHEGHTIVDENFNLQTNVTQLIGVYGIV
jgi:glycosyltransferase involved in cell wall biosynthesis